MKLSKVRIVLVETSHPGNIGSTARAMKTMGLARLYLVNPKHFPDERASSLASSAHDILENAVCTETLDEALKEVKCIFMTSARIRGIALPIVTPEQAAETAFELADPTEIALVFGRERTGLFNEELLKGNYHIEIPTNPDYSSLNLSQAVQIVAYEFSKLGLTKKPVQAPQDELASFEEVERFYEHLQKTLKSIGFIKPSNPKQVLYKLKRLFNRAKLETNEVHILRGILTQVSQIISRPKDGKD